MSIEPTRKRSFGSEPTRSGGEAKRPPLASENPPCGFHHLPDECRNQILRLLEVEDLGNTAQACLLLRDDCRDPSLLQIRVATVVCSGHAGPYSQPSLRALLSKLGVMQSTGKFARFCKLKIVGLNQVTKIGMAGIHEIIRTNSIQLSDVTMLDLSLSKSLDSLTGTERRVECNVFTALGLCTRGLIELDVSGMEYPREGFTAITKESGSTLQKLIWNRPCGFAGLDGFLLEKFRNLKELSMDNAIFRGTETYLQHFIDQTEEGCIFHKCNKKLESVSFKFYTSMCAEKSPEPLPQAALIKFVCKTPSLRWFRSDLSLENVAVLKAERPEVTFT